MWFEYLLRLSFGEWIVGLAWQYMYMYSQQIVLSRGCWNREGWSDIPQHKPTALCSAVPLNLNCWLFQIQDQQFIHYTCTMMGCPKGWHNRAALNWRSWIQIVRILEIYFFIYIKFNRNNKILKSNYIYLSVYISTISW